MNFLKSKKAIIAIILIIIAGGSYYYYKKKQAASSQVQYVTAPAEKGTLTTSISASGNIVVDQSSSIDPTITGTVSNVAVKVGDQVKKGQLLFTIVNNQLGVSVAQANSSLVSAQGQLKSAKAQKESAQASLKADQKKNDATPHTVNSEQIEADKKQITAAEASIDSALASINAASANLGYQGEQAGKRNVTSPINGTVNAVNIKNGDDLSRISSGNNAVAPIIIGDLGTMKSQVQVNEVDVANVSIGQKAMLKFDAIDALETTGTVEKMDSLGTLSSGVVTYNVTIDFDSLDNRIKPGMSVTASIITQVKQDILIVPTSAVKNDNSGDYVEVLASGATTPERKNVQAGLSNGMDTEIVSGVNAGDNVVTQTINSNSTTTTNSSSTPSTNRSTSSSGLRLPGLGGGGRSD
jgi:RND family efflux transporter MFP subunit